MDARSLSQMSDAALELDLHAAVGRERTSTVESLAFIGEFDARGLHLPAGYPSMFQYCLSELSLSEDSASKRIRAARAARRCPAVLAALAEGGLHLSAVVLLAPRLTPESEDEQIAAASRRSKTQIELMLPERFPSEGGPTTATPVPFDSIADSHAPGHASTPSTHSKVTPLSSGRYRLETTIEQLGYDDLALSKALLPHTSPWCDAAEVMQQALRMLAAHLLKRASSATAKPRAQLREAKGRHVPAAVRREVWQRDGGRCAFVSESGVRCGSNRLVRLDHIVRFAEGGKSTSEILRRLCGPHDQFEVKRRLGAGSPSGSNASHASGRRTGEPFGWPTNMPRGK